MTTPSRRASPGAKIRVELQTAASGLASPILVLPAPGAGARLFVVDQAGLVRLIENGALRAEPFLDVTPWLVPLNQDFDERGLLGLAVDPDFEKAGQPGFRRIFTYCSEPVGKRSDFPNPHAGDVPPDHQGVLTAWQVAADGSRVDPGTRREVLRIDEPQFNHNGGMIAFGPDGLLYLALGDGGAGNDLGPGHNPTTGNGQDQNVVLGKMLRIDVNGTDSGERRVRHPA